MLLIQATPGPSAIAGTGLFATQDILKDTVVWKFDPRVDTASVVQPNSDMFYSYISKQTGRLITPGDDARHINHSDTPNVGTRYEDGAEEDINFALRDIAAGEELTLDYRGFAKEGLDF